MTRKRDITTKVCNDNRTCFARYRAYGGTGPLICTVLTDAYPVVGQCPFCKPEREITKGKHYPYNPEYQYWYAKKHGEEATSNA